MQKSQVHAYFSLTLAVFFWSGNLVFGRYLHDTLPPFGISFWRWSIAFAVLFLFNIHRLFHFFRLLKRYFYPFFWLSFFGIVLTSSLQYVGLDYTSASDAGIMITLMPIFIAICGEIILKERTSSLQKLGMGLAFFGALILISKGRLSDILKLELNFGDMVLLIASLTWGIYTSLLKKFSLLCSDWELIQATSFISLLMISIILFSHGKAAVDTTFLAPMHLMTVLSLLYMGLGASLVSFWGWNHGVSVLGASRAGPFLYLAPIFSGILAMIFLGERLHTYHWTGAAIILIGVSLSLQKKQAS